MDVKDLRAKIREILKDIDNSIEETDIIISHFTNLTRGQILLNKQITKTQAKSAINLAKKRAKNIPLQYLLGKWPFFGLYYKVGEGVLIPRFDTEILIEAVINKIGNKNIDKIVDLCSGTGCIAISLEKNMNVDKVLAIENSKDAIKYLKYNIKELDSKVEVIDRDILDEKSIDGIENVDIITVNPPYLNKDEIKSLQKEVEYEPKCALYGGDDGLKYYRELIPIWKKVLKSGGYFVFEIGNNQENDVIKILNDNKMVETFSFKDYNNIIRVIMSKKE